MRKLPIVEERIDVDGPRGQKPANLRIRDVAETVTL